MSRAVVLTDEVQPTPRRPDRDLACERMERLRTLSEAECYERCYGWRYSEDTVKVLPRGGAPPAESRRRRREAADAARASPRRARARSRLTDSAVPDVLGPDLDSSSAASTPAAGAPPPRRLRESPQRLLAVAARCGFTPRCSSPGTTELLRYGIGLTNAARRTTRGSSDLRAADFAGSRDRLEAIALDLEPGVIAFVGKAAYQGVFASAPSTDSRSATLGPARCSCFRRPRRRMPPSRGTSGFAGFGPYESL